MIAITTMARNITMTFHIYYASVNAFIKYQYIRVCICTYIFIYVHRYLMAC